MTKLQDILYRVHLKQVHGSTDITVSGIQIDSRKLEAGNVFVAIRGVVSDGHEYIDKAIANGASVIVCDTMPARFEDGVTYLEVADTQEAVAYMAHQFYDEPSLKLKLVGVTGTNGKTTIATVLFKLFNKLGYKCGLISTVQNQIGDEIIPSTHTTPDAVSLNALLKLMLDAGCRVGMLAAAKERIDEVLRFKSNMDSGMFLPVQLAAAKALELGKDWYDSINTIYAERRTKVFEMLDLLNCSYATGQVGMFVWAKIPATFTDGFALSDKVLYEASVFITPGGIFGDAGNGYIRVSLCGSIERFEEAIQRIKTRLVK